MSHLVLAALAAGVVLSSHRLRAQSAGDQPISIDTAAGRTSGALRVPATPARPPVVCLVSAVNADELAAALAARGVATLRVDAASGAEDTLAQWIAYLRNNDRFPTVTVFGEGPSLLAAVVAARAARADGVITRGDTTSAAAELSRVVATKRAAVGASLAGEAASIAEFVRSVPVLGRRGTRETRAGGPRRSLRHVIMTSVGAVRVAIEWGQPQKRGRDIWGELLPWNEVWMPGADEATVITTDGPLTIGSIDVPAGDHTFYTLPAADKFQLLISRDVGQFHTVYDPTRVIGTVDMTATTRPDSVEGLTFAIDANGTAGTLKLIWDTREYSTPVSARR